MSDRAAYIVSGVRTPIGRFGGALASARPDDLAAHVLAETMRRRPEIKLDQIDEVVMGCTNQAGEDNRNVARMALLLAGLPNTIPGTTVNRLCGSGLDAVSFAARSIIAGEADLVLAGGVESMTRAPFVMPKATAGFQRTQEIADSTIGWRFVHPRMSSICAIENMGETAENVAQDFEISRADQDAFAFRSQERAALAIRSGRLSQEISPILVSVGKQQTEVVRDEHPRETSIEKLGTLNPAFRKGGSVTPGNSAGINDGAAALLIASQRALETYGLEPLARIRGVATAGVAPRVMGLGPIPATQKLLDRIGWRVGSLDLIELNEAFAAQALACLRGLGLPDDARHVNPNGGAIALGHPLGMTGARLALTLAVDMHAQKQKRGLASMCIGIGMGISLALEGV